jgi:hypothetical protein
MRQSGAPRRIGIAVKSALAAHNFKTAWRKAAIEQAVWTVGVLRIDSKTHFCHARGRASHRRGPTLRAEARLTRKVK